MYEGAKTDAPSDNGRTRPSRNKLKKSKGLREGEQKRGSKSCTHYARDFVLQPSAIKLELTDNRAGLGRRLKKTFHCVCGFVVFFLRSDRVRFSESESSAFPIGKAPILNFFVLFFEFKMAKRKQVLLSIRNDSLRRSQL